MQKRKKREFRKIKALLYEKNITQLECAKKLGIAVSTLNRKLNGECDWKLGECIIISKMFELPIEEIFMPKKLPKSVDKRVV